MFVEILILSQLMDGPRYGYEIKKNVQKFFRNGYQLNDNEIYPLLKKYQTKGIAEKELMTQHGKPNKYIYNITEEGSKLFHELISDFPHNISYSSDEFLTRVAFFDFMDNSHRQKILDIRADYLLAFRDFCENYLKNFAGGNYLPNICYFREYEIKKIDLELQMIEDLRKRFLLM